MSSPEIGSVCNGREDVLFAALKDFDEEDISLLHEEQLLQQELLKIRKSLMFDELNIRSLSSVDKSEMNDRLSQVFQEMAALAAKKAQVLTTRVALMRNIIEPGVVQDETTSKSLPMPKRIPRVGDHPRRRAQSYHAGVEPERSNFEAWLSELSRKEEQRPDKNKICGPSLVKSNRWPCGESRSLDRPLQNVCEEKRNLRTRDRRAA